MKIKSKITLSFSVGIILLILSFRIGFFRNSGNDFIQFLNKILVGNEMRVNASNEIDINKIRINLVFSHKIVFEHNHFLDNIANYYGGPVFDVYYKDMLIGRAFHDNTNNWYTNKFDFDFYKERERIKFKFKTYGRDKNGEEGYTNIEKLNDCSIFESYDHDGKLINKWQE